jgi:hypothetical protein
VLCVIAARVTQVDAPGERDVTFGFGGVSDHDEFLVMGTADPDALIEQHLTARAFDRLA